VLQEQVIGDTFGDTSHTYGCRKVATRAIFVSWCCLDLKARL